MFNNLGSENKQLKKMACPVHGQYEIRFSHYHIQTESIPAFYHISVITDDLLVQSPKLVHQKPDLPK